MRGYYKTNCLRRRRNCFSQPRLSTAFLTAVSRVSLADHEIHTIIGINDGHGVPRDFIILFCCFWRRRAVKFNLNHDVNWQQYIRTYSMRVLYWFVCFYVKVHSIHFLNKGTTFYETYNNDIIIWGRLFSKCDSDIVVLVYVYKNIYTLQEFESFENVLDTSRVAFRPRVRSSDQNKVIIFIYLQILYLHKIPLQK